jgi:hypothetical protein
MRLSRPQSRSGRRGEVKMFYPTGTRTPTLGPPVPCQSLYWLRYPRRIFRRKSSFHRTTRVLHPGRQNSSIRLLLLRQTYGLWLWLLPCPPPKKKNTVRELLNILTETLQENFLFWGLLICDCPRCGILCCDTYVVSHFGGACSLHLLGLSVTYKTTWRLSTRSQPQLKYFC